jgi:hypothetical protein
MTTIVAVTISGRGGDDDDDGANLGCLAPEMISSVRPTSSQLCHVHESYSSSKIADLCWVMFLRLSDKIIEFSFQKLTQLDIARWDL